MAPSRRPTGRVHQKRDRYLRAAANLFLERGYEGASLDEIVKAVGGSKTSLYTCFGDKQGLFVAVVEELCAEVLASVEELDLSDMELADGLHTFARRLIQPLLQPRHFAFHRLIVAESARFPELSRAWYLAGPEESYRRIGEFLAAKQAAGQMRPVQPRRAAALFHDGLLYDVFHRAMIGLDLAPTPAEVEAVIAEAVAMFVRAYGVPAEGR